MEGNTKKVLSTIAVILSVCAMLVRCAGAVELDAGRARNLGARHDRVLRLAPGGTIAAT